MGTICIQADTDVVYSWLQPAFAFSRAIDRPELIAEKSVQKCNHRAGKTAFY
jgi:hypothetical protein